MRVYMLKKILIILFLIFFSFPALAKFTSPFKGTLLPEKAKAEIGKVVVLTLRLETKEKFGEVEVSIKLPKGLELIKGEKVSRVVNFAPGEKKKFYYRVRVKEKGEQQVIIGVKIKGLSEGLGLGTTFVSLINPEPVKDNGTHTVDSDGTRAFVK